MDKDILIISELRGDDIKRVTAEVITLANKISRIKDCKIICLAFGIKNDNIIESLKEYGADKVIFIDNPSLKDYSATTYKEAIYSIIKSIKPFFVMMGYTAKGKDLLPRLAAKCKTGLVSDCIDLTVDGGQLLFKRPVYAGKAISTIKFKDNVLNMAGIRPNSVKAEKCTDQKNIEVESFDVNITEDPVCKTKLIRFEESQEKRADLTEANIVVSAGRGIKGPEHFNIIERLADALGGSIGASRAVVDAGWKDHQFQVGQTGKTVSPELYIACGISGAIQHLAGMSSSKFIVAINKDADANIFKYADFGIVGDLFELIPLLTEEIEKSKTDH